MKKLKLPPWTAFHRDVRLLVWRPRRIVNEAEVQTIVEMLDKMEEECAHPFNRYTDLSRIDAIDLRFEFVFRISLHRRMVYAKFPPVKSAFYITSEASERIVRAHAMLTDHSPLQVKMFREVAAAAQWLGVPAEELEMAP